MIATRRDRERARAREAGEGDRDPDWAHDAQSGREIVLAAVEQDATALRWASEAFGNDRAVVLAAAKQWGASVLEHADRSVLRDLRVLLEAVGSMCTCEDLIHWYYQC